MKCLILFLLSTPVLANDCSKANGGVYLQKGIHSYDASLLDPNGRLEFNKNGFAYFKIEIQSTDTHLATYGYRAIEVRDARPDGRICTANPSKRLYSKEEIEFISNENFEAKFPSTYKVYDGGLNKNIQDSTRSGLTNNSEKK